MSKIIGDEACPQCREAGGDKSGNHLMVFENGNKFCNRCQYKETDGTSTSNKGQLMPNNQLTVEAIKEYSTREYRDIDQAILEEAGVKTGISTTTGDVEDVFYPVYHTDGTLLGYKQRHLPKQFYTIGNLRDKPKQLFGQPTVGEGGKLLVIVEGEDDTLTGRQILRDLGKGYNIVGIPFGAAHAEAVARDNINWLESFETVIIVPDQDEPGMDAAKAIASVLTPGKVKFGKHSEKDVCDLYKEGKSKEFLNAIWRAKVYTPKGIIAAGDREEEFFASKGSKTTYYYPEMFPELNKMSDGFRGGELVLWTAGTGAGKSQIVDQCLEYWLTQGLRVGAIKMEHNVDRNLENLLSVHIGVNLKIPELAAQISEDELREHYRNFYGDNRFLLIDHSVEGESSILETIRYLAVAQHCKIIVIDHLHAIMYETSDENENQRMDSILRSLWKMAQQYDIAIHCIAHPRKSGSGAKSAEAGGFISLDDLKGSSALKQVPDGVISALRDSSAEDEHERRTAHIHMLKNRWMGHTGPADSIIFDVNTTNYTRVEPEQTEY